MKFNKIQNKYKLLILLAAEIIISFFYTLTENEIVRTISFIIYLVIFFFIFQVMWQMIGLSTFGKLKDLIKKIFKFLLSKTKFLFNKIKLTLKAIGLGGLFDKVDSMSFEFDFNLSNKIKRLFRSRIRLDMKNADGNSEKIKFMYIRLILKSINNGYDYKDSQTPDELYTMLKNENLEYLIRLYKSVRYDRYIKISDEEIEECERELNIVRSKKHK